MVTLNGEGFIAHTTPINWFLHAKSDALLTVGDFKQQYLHITQVKQSDLETLTGQQKS